ncbi:Caspase domain containing protein [Flavobacteriaceae bacterium]
MPVANNLYYPKGYGLCVGINEFVIFNDLEACLSDVEYWQYQMVQQRGYEYVVQLKDANATLRNVIASLWLLAQKAIAGDIVFISFSTHGTADYKGFNKLYLHDNIFTERMLHFMLKAFKPLVRVYVVTDICQSGTFIGGVSSPISDNEIILIRAAMATLSTQAVSECDVLIANQESLKISASVAHIASVGDQLYVPDGILVKESKNTFKWSFSYTAEEYRADLEQRFENNFYNNASKLVQNLNFYGEKDSRLKNYLLKQCTFNEQTLEEYVKTAMNHNMIFTSFIPVLKSNNYTFDGDLFVVEDFNKFLDNWLNKQQIAWLTNPILTYVGRKSIAFENQYVFKKYSRDYYNENV